MSEQASAGTPGEPYDWYVRGVALLRDGHPQAATVALQRVVDAEPASRSAREALARAEYGSGRYEAARDLFAANLAADPTDDYAAFGVGLAEGRLGNHFAAVEHLAMASAMRPGNHHYSTALRAARARAQ